MDAGKERVEDALAELLRDAVQAGVFPGAVAAVGELVSGEARSVVACAGALEPGGRAVERDTVYDLASLTKPVVATLALRLCQAERVDLHAPVTHWLPELEGTIGGAASLSLLLSHRAGLSPWGGLFKEVARETWGTASACAYMLREAAQRVGPAPTPIGSVYSDLGYLIAGEALARAGGASLDALIKREVSGPLGLASELFYAASLDWEARERLRVRAAPTEYCAFRGGVVRAAVHDENCAAFGGICGHAGLFGTARAVLAFGLELLSALQGRSRWIDQALLRWALTARPGGGHVVGWDTKSAEGSSAGSLLSARSFGHLGFTGTSIWCDPIRERCIVLLSNRVHPTRDNIAIRELRPRFHDRVAALTLD